MFIPSPILQNSNHRGKAFILGKTENHPFSLHLHAPYAHSKNITEQPHYKSLEHFDACHITTLIIIAAIACSLIFFCKNKTKSQQNLITTPLAYLCFFAYPISLIAWNLAELGNHIENVIPLHLCDLAVFACGFALITRKEKPAELAYFWGLAGTLQGLITPAIPVAFPHPIFVAFFYQHGIVVIVALLLPLGLNWKPEPKSILRVFLYTQLYVALAMLFNLFAETNYGFLASKPKTASLLDALPEWPYYILVLEAICLVAYTLLYLPFLISNYREKRKIITTSNTLK